MSRWLGQAAERPGFPFLEVEAAATDFAFSAGQQVGYIALAEQYDQARHFLELDTASQPAGSGGGTSITVIKAWLDPDNPRIVVSYYGSGSDTVKLRWRIMRVLPGAGIMVQQGVVTDDFPATGADQYIAVTLPQTLPATGKTSLVINVAGGAFKSDNGAAEAFGLYAVIHDASTLRLYANYNNGGSGVAFTLPWCVIYGR